MPTVEVTVTTTTVLSGFEVVVFFVVLVLFVVVDVMVMMTYKSLAICVWTMIKGLVRPRSSSNV